MRVSYLAAQFCATEKQSVIGHFVQTGALNRTCEAGPTGTRFEHVCRTEKGFARDNVDVNTLFLVIPELVVERRLGPFTLGNFIL